MAVARELCSKYEEILRLRRERTEEAPTARLRALAARFPGALRELDSLPEAEIERRIALLITTESGGEAPWMVGMHRFHIELGALLRVKRWLGTQGDRSDLVSSFTLAHSGDEPALRWRERLASIVRPPEGRLSQLALNEAASQVGIDPDELRRWLGAQ